MESSFHVRRSTAIFLLAIVLLSALTCSAVGIGLVALIPFLFFVAAVISLFVPFTEELRLELQLLAVPAFSPRPPPVR
jgi:uncharacterized protein (DUF58 family)